MSFYTRFATHYERVFPFRHATLDFLRRHLPERGRVLDLGCGTGHYTGALARAGLEAIGLDLDPAMITAARTRYADARFVVADLGAVRSICAEADGAFCIGNVLPHLPPTRLVSFLTDLARILPAGAPWIVQTVNFDRLLPLREPVSLPELDAGEGLIFRRRYEPGLGGSLRFVTALVSDQQTVFTGEASLWPLTSSDLQAAHEATGFDLVSEHGGFAGEDFTAAASGGLVQVYRR
jgi:glycine/sarcosine N-methyltransferase